ncbi:MAG: PepSY domain-containing protein [Vicinamibacterales bacterium]
MTRKLFMMIAAVVTVPGLFTVEAGTAPRSQAAAQKQSTQLERQLKALPEAVKASVERETQNATLKGISKEKENGKTVYEVETLVGGRTRDLMIDSAGSVLSVEEQLDADKAPGPVRSALEARGTIVTLESLTQNGKTTYEAQVKTRAGKRVVMELDADGHPLKK